MKIGIIGVGNIGSALAKHFSKLRHTVLIANSRGPATLSKVAQETGAQPVPIAEVANGVDLLVITIPMKNIPALPPNLLVNLPPSSPIIDTGNYYPHRDGTIAEVANGMVESEWTSQALGRPVIKVFNNLAADSLVHKGQPKGSKDRVALPVSGDDIAAKQRVIALLDDMGFDGLDAGPLSASWRFQPGTPAYGPDPTIRQLPSLLRKANQTKAPASRDQAAKLMSKLPPGFPPQQLVRVARLSVGLDAWKPRSWFAILHLLFAVLTPHKP